MRTRLICQFFQALAPAMLAGCAILGEDEGEAASEAIGTTGACPPSCSPGGGSQDQSATDGVKNGSETDVDCGGTAAPCADGKACVEAKDCQNQVCGGGSCQSPSPTDGVKNGKESDVDCGGEGNPQCAVGKSCTAHSDCTSDGCDYKKTCVPVRSCTGHFGGDTCGTGEVEAAGASHESCCMAKAAPSGTIGVDLYPITAGRMRAFAERTNGDFRSFVASLPPTHPYWKQEWNGFVPGTMADLYYLLGPTGQGPRSGCDLADSKARTYWMPDEVNTAQLGEPRGHLFSKDVLDAKMLNCVDWYLLQALCVWDGGRLMTQDEFAAVWRADENRTYPWGNTAFSVVQDATRGRTPDGVLRVVWGFNRAWPQDYTKGNWIYIPEPGRVPGGRGKYGHADLGGALYEYTFDTRINAGAMEANWAASGSWEGHGVAPGAVSYTFSPPTRAYWALGGRCAR